ncbi:MAG TPA: hypothetical protein VM074_07065 [Solimonas sp.]|nr:hypothetical protein [Solimonas sp.]
MRIKLLCLACVPLLVQAQMSSTNYALPGSAREVTALVMPSGAPGNFALTQGGVVPSQAAATCDNRADSSTYRSDVGFVLERYAGDGLQNLQNKVEAYKMIGSFAVTARQEYDQVGADPTDAGRTRFLKKGPFSTETNGGAEAATWSVTESCFQEAKPTATHQYYNARLVGDGTWLDIRISMYADSPDQARKYASEVIAKVRKLDYTSVK